MNSRRQNMWPRVEDDFMEIGDTGWVPVGEGMFRNKYTGHIIDEAGMEYDKFGQPINHVDEE